MSTYSSSRRSQRGGDGLTLSTAQLSLSSSSQFFSGTFDDDDLASSPSTTSSSPSAFVPETHRSSRARQQRGDTEQEKGGWTEPVIPSRLGNFDLVTEEKLDFANVKIVKWQSRVSGLKVVWAQADGPLISGHVQVNTEIFNDSGCPHTLEHLDFCGSQQFPYNGVLDQIGNRMFGNGTNAWTEATDTTYTCSLASEEGFLKLLPVYLDHIFFPLLRESSFVTEVYNLNGKGEDGGVVFSEMQGSATSAGNLIQLKLQQTLFNKRNGNRSETGGLLPALRKLDISRIADYHASMYVPQNVTVMAIGSALDPAKLLATLQEKVEPTFVRAGMDEGPRPRGWRRPFVESSTVDNPPEIVENETQEVLYPSRSETVGSITIAWIGPPALDFLTNTALTLLGQYLTDSAIAPLSKIFVEISDPACSGISFSASGNPQILSAGLDGVPFAKLDALPEKFLDALAKIAAAGIDLEAMRTQINGTRLGVLESVERSPAGYLYGTLNDDALYGPEDGSQIKAAFADLDYCRILSRWTSEQWAELLEKYYVDPKCLTIIGRPNAKMVDDIARDNKARIAANVAKYGPAGLAQLDAKIKAAEKTNAKPVPDALLRGFKVPDVKEIKWITAVGARSPGVARAAGGLGKADPTVQACVDRDGVDLPLFAEFQHFKSNFVTITITAFPGSPLDAHLTELIPLYLDTFGGLPVNRADGTKLDYQQVVKQTNADLIATVMSSRGESLVFSVNVVKESYGIALAWMKDLLWGSVFSVERLKNSIVQSIASLPDEKEDGSSVASDAFVKMITGENSINYTSNIFHRSKSTPAILQRLRQAPEQVVADLKALRQAFTDPRAMRVCVSGDILGLEKPVASWLTHFEPLTPFKPEELIPVLSVYDTMSPLGHNPSSKMRIICLPSIESTYGQFGCAGPSHWDHPDTAALTVARGALNATEGFLWNAIRGAGLAYDVGISHSIENGIVGMVIFKSPDTFAAWDTTRKLIDDIVSRKVPVTELDIAAAKSTYAYSLASGHANQASAAGSAFSNSVIHGRPAHYSRIALERATAVTLPEVVRAIRKYIAPLFHPDTSIGSVTCGTGKVPDMVKGFQGAGYDISRKTFG